MQACGWVNSVYTSSPAPPALPPGAASRLVSASIQWQPLSAPRRYGEVGVPLAPLSPISASALAPALTPDEVTRRALQSGLARGWGTWVFDDLIALVSLPSGATVRPKICKRSSLQQTEPDTHHFQTTHTDPDSHHPQAAKHTDPDTHRSQTTHTETDTHRPQTPATLHCLDTLIVNRGGEGGASEVRVGSHAYDRSYAEVKRNDLFLLLIFFTSFFLKISIFVLLRSNASASRA